MTTQQQTNGYLTIKQILASVKNDLGMHDYDRDDESIMQWIIEAYSELNMTSGDYGIKSEWLTINSIGALDFPLDYISYVAVGYVYNGRVWTYGRDNRLIGTRQLECGEEVADTDLGELASIEENVINHYDQRGGININYFKEDRLNRRFIFDNVNITDVLLIYRTTGITLSTTNYIPRICLKYIKEYVQFNMSRRNRASQNEILMNESRMEYELKKLRRLSKRITIDEIKDIFYRTSTQGIKR